MSDTEPCPAAEQLQELLLGALPEEASAIISEHLANCSPCQITTQSLAVSDTFVNLVRVAGQRPMVVNPLELDKVITTLDDRTQAAALSMAQSETMLSEFNDSVTGSKPRTTSIADELTDLLSGVRASETPDELGRIGDFRLLKLLGHGGMGAVFLAEDVRLQRPVALKLVRAEIARNRDGNERFLREARAAAKIKHVNVVTIYQVGEENGIPFLAQDLLEGETLESRLARQGRFSVTEALSIGQQIAAGLAAAHARHLIHRDIKPANVFLALDPHLPDATECVKLLDFGLARAISENIQLTQSGMIIGTPAFMSPEQAGGETVDHRSDLFSLGCILYVMLTGERPFRGENVMRVLSSLANDTPASVKTIRSDVSTEVSHLIDQLLAKTASDRPDSASDVAGRLARLVTVPTEPPFPRSVTGQTASGKQPPKNPFKRPIALFGGAVASLVLAAIIITITHKDGTKTELKVDDGSKIDIVHQSDDSPRPPVNAGKPGMITTANTPEFQRWEQEVSAMSSEQQVVAVALKLKELNPEFDGKVTGFDGQGTPKIEGNVVTGLGFISDNVTDVSPVRALRHLKELLCAGSGNRSNNALSNLLPLQGLPLTSLNFAWTQVADLSPLKGMPLTNLRCDASKVSDLSPLKGMPLKIFGFCVTPVSDLSPLRGMRLESINLANTAIVDLSPLKQMPLKSIICGGTKIADLSPLQGMPLKSLTCNGTKVSDLTPLKGMSLDAMSCAHTPVADLSPLKGMPLISIDFVGTKVSDASPLEGMNVAEIWFTPKYITQGLNSIRQMRRMRTIYPGTKDLTAFSPEEFWRKYDAGDFTRVTTYDEPGFQQWMDEVATWSVEKQVELVAGKLQELNPWFDGKVEISANGGPGIENGVVTGLTFLTDHVTDLSPLRALSGLKALTLNAGFSGIGIPDGKLTDLSPLKTLKLTNFYSQQNPISDPSPLHRMPLTHLTLFNAKVANLMPLNGMPLMYLDVSRTEVADLSPLRGMPMRTLMLGFTHVSDLSPLEGMKLTLLMCNATKITDLSPLHGMPLEGLSMDLLDVVDLSPLRGMPLTTLLCSGTKVTDLSPLKGMPLVLFYGQRNRITDLSALQGMPLKQLAISFTPVTDLSPLQGMSLTEITLTPGNITQGLDIIRQTQSIQTIATGDGGDRSPPNEFWKKYDAGEFGKPPVDANAKPTDKK